MAQAKIKILDHIPVGQENAVTRTQLCIKTGLPDRKVRNLIHSARRDVPILNLSDSKGYFIPDLEKPHEVKLLRDFAKQETSRLKSVGWALKSTRKALRQIKDTNDTD